MIRIAEKLEPASLKIKSTQGVTFESSDIYYVLRTIRPGFHYTTTDTTTTQKQRDHKAEQSSFMLIALF